MSTKSKLLAIMESLQFPAEGGQLPPPVQASPQAIPEETMPVVTAPQFPPVVPRSAPRTGPGQMLQFRGQMLATENEIGRLKDQLKDYEGASATKKLDTVLISPSRWANRHPDSFSGAAFLRLKQDIEQAGGNVQPILVRPLPDQSDRYEIIFGHRRHRACSELGLPVLATIDTTSLTDLDVFSIMDRENRERADLSPYEQGTMYRRALDQGLYASNRRLAEALGVSHTWVANVLLVADLPPAVLCCFSSPTVVNHRHAKALVAALEMDRKGVLRRAEKLRQQPGTLAASAVVDALIGGADEDSKTLDRRLIKVDGRAVGRWNKDSAGRLNIQLDPGVVGDALTDDDIVQAITKALHR